MAQVYKVASGRKWAVRFYYDGKKVEIRDPRKIGLKEEYWSTASITEKAMVRQSEIIRVKYIETLKKEQENSELPNLPFSELVWEYLRYKEGLVSWETYRVTKSLIDNHVSVFFGEGKIKDCLTRSRISEYRDWLSKSGCSTNIKNLSLSKLGEMIDYFSAKGYATSETFSAVSAFLKPFKAERVPVTVKEFWTKDEWEKFIGTITDFRMKVLYEVAYWCALRIGEVLGLRYSDFDFEGKTLYIQRQKIDGGKYTCPKTASSNGKVKVRSEVLEDVKKLMEEDGGGDAQLFDICEMSLRRRFESDIEKAGVKKIVFHGLRHSMATRMLWSGMNATEVSHHLRHANPSITMQVYVHYIPEKNESRIDSL